MVGRSRKFSLCETTTDPVVFLQSRCLSSPKSFSLMRHSFITFLVADTQLHKRLCPAVRRSVMVIELESVKICISAPAHPSATGIGRVSGLVSHVLNQRGAQVHPSAKDCGRVSGAAHSLQRPAYTSNCHFSCNQCVKPVCAQIEGMQRRK